MTYICEYYTYAVLNERLKGQTRQTTLIIFLLSNFIFQIKQQNINISRRNVFTFLFLNFDNFTRMDFSYFTVYVPPRCIEKLHLLNLSNCLLIVNYFSKVKLLLNI